MNLKGKVAIVTGGARDIGRQISIKLAKEGAKIIVNYFNSDKDAQETKRLITSDSSSPLTDAYGTDDSISCNFS